MYKLLIVDDEPLMRRGIKFLVNLNELGINKVFEAGNGLEALEIFDKERPELLLLDINMPKMDGLTFASEVKSRNKETRICIITGYDYFDYAVKALRTGVDEYILKPVSKKDIDLVLRKMILELENSNVKKELNKIDVKETEASSSIEEQLINIVNEEIYQSNFSLSNLSEKMGFSSGYLSGIFKDVFGLPFQDYVIQSRMEKAKLLLLTTDYKNYEVAEQIGIEDVNYFATRFKKTVGLTPKQYKKKVKSNE